MDETTRGGAAGWAGTDLRGVMGLGVAGNFAGHLEQAGEAGDFAQVRAAAGRPKGVFPFYLPPAGGGSAEGGADAGEAPGFLRVFPLSRDTIRHPGRIGGRPAQLQIEPELALACRLEYDGPAGRVAAVVPTHFTAYNDCSTRRPDATKISQKKNWGPQTKGLDDDQWIALEPAGVAGFAPGGRLDRFRLACFLQRDGELLAYGEDSPVAGPAGYSTMYRPLLDWITQQLNQQTDHGPLEDLSACLAAAGHPARAVISIGATRYTPLGETTYLEPGDESIVLAYDAQTHPADRVAELIASPPAGAGVSYALLRQRVVADLM